ncbi:hypothetical protein Dxin01_00865 [Deinococcus xinjiangensis]|uniref:ASCH domain-containing protein n=1 Tax=Deinococcus xinjiangensis TaxID=457454 RepID=A0ABP9V787_9DEIO
MIKGITYRHPWAVAVAWLHKDIENRLWHPQSKEGQIGMYLAIHGGGTPVYQYQDEFDDDLEWLLELLSDPQERQGFSAAEEQHWQNFLSTGDTRHWITPGIVAVAQVSAVTRGHRSHWAARNQFNWVLTGTVRLPTPVRPGPGLKKNLWDLDEHTLREVRRQYALGRKAA